MRYITLVVVVLIVTANDRIPSNALSDLRVVPNRRYPLRPAFSPIGGFSLLLADRANNRYCVSINILGRVNRARYSPARNRRISLSRRL